MGVLLGIIQILFYGHSEKNSFIFHLVKGLFEDLMRSVNYSLREKVTMWKNSNVVGKMFTKVLIAFTLVFHPFPQSSILSTNKEDIFWEGAQFAVNKST